MSNDEPTPGRPEDDPFLKQPPPGSPYGSSGGGSGGSGGGGGFGGGGSGDGFGGPPPPYGGFGGDPFGGPDPLLGMPPLATLGQRLLARIVDVVIVLVPLAILSLLIGGWDWSSEDFGNTGRQWVWSLLSVVGYVGYDAYMTVRNGQTFGKRWLKLRVAMLDTGDVPNGSASLMRAVVLWLPALICCFCLWWIVIFVSMASSKPYRQGLHDKAARTVVVSAA